MARTMFAISFSISAAVAALYIALMAWAMLIGRSKVFWQPYPTMFLLTSVALLVCYLFSIKIRAYSLLVFSTTLLASMLFSVFETFAGSVSSTDFDIGGALFLIAVLSLSLIGFASAILTLRRHVVK